MSSSAGKVLILPKGEYNNATQYQMLDAVRYNGSLYIAKQTTIGHVPEDGEYWMLSAIGASDVHWGDITGSIASQSDLINALDAKQNVLTFDSTPTASSNNPVTSAGIKTALDTKQDTLTFDTTPTSGSTNPVTSSGIHTAVQATASNLATIESSTTASQAYSEGDYLVLNGQLYEVIADIASGETLTVGTNISATTVGSELTALNNGLMPYPDYANGVEITSSFPSDPRSTTTNSFTLPVNALISFVADKTSQGFTLFALVDDNKVATIPANVVFGGVAMTFPVKKGSVLSFKTDSTGATWQLRRVDYFPLVMG